MRVYTKPSILCLPHSYSILNDKYTTHFYDNVMLLLSCYIYLSSRIFYYTVKTTIKSFLSLLYTKKKCVIKLFDIINMRTPQKCLAFVYYNVFVPFLCKSFRGLICYLLVYNLFLYKYMKNMLDLSHRMFK